jgi:6-phosphogluconolactonase
MDPTFLIFDSAHDAAAACGDRTLEILDRARHERGVATLAVSGGSTPRLMFQSMAGRPFNWKGIEIFQVDERCVPPDHAESNFRMLSEALLTAVSIRESQVHRIKGELPPDDAARDYINEIRRTFEAQGLTGGPLPVFDCIQRGTGPDAHTASLFPGEPLIADRTRIAAAVDATRAGMQGAMRYRVTLLRGVLESARHTLCLATGAEKAEALHKVLKGPSDPMQLPSQIVSADTVWYLDKNAAAKL